MPKRVIRLSLVNVLLLCASLAPVAVRAGSSNSLLDISADGRWLAAANRDNGTVSIVDTQTNKVVHETAVGHKPEGVTFLGDTARLAVSVYGDDKVVIVDAAEGKVTGSIDVFDEPYGVVSTRDGKTVYVTLEFPGQVAEIDVDRMKITRTLDVGPFVRGLALVPDEQRLLVTEYLTGAVVTVERGSGKVLERLVGASSDNIARQIVAHPTRPKAYVPHIRSRVNVNRGEGSVVPFVTVVDTNVHEGKRRAPLPMDSFIGTFVVANPWETAISPDGSILCAVFAGTDDMYVCAVLDDDYRELSFRKGIQLGHNPRAAKFSPDGLSLYVYNTLDFQVVAYSVPSFKKAATIDVCQNPLKPEVLRGKVLFYTALEPMVGRRWISCSSCHPDGDADGRTWQNPEGLRNTTALYGMGWTHPLHWSADRDESQDFEHTIRSQLMQGRGLVRNRNIPDALGEPLKGMSSDLDALASYSNSHHTPISPFAKSGLSDAAKRGKELFFAASVGCAECHSGPYFSNSSTEKPYKLHDVGTGNDDPSEKMGPKYDTPSLLSVYRTAPYLHHGKAATLMDVINQNTGDKHGKTSQLSPEQKQDLVEFMKALPFEDPEPAARAAGLVKIE